jgi:hypothetical protein
VLSTGLGLEPTTIALRQSFEASDIPLTRKQNPLRLCTSSGRPARKRCLQACSCGSITTVWTASLRAPGRSPVVGRDELGSCGGRTRRVVPVVSLGAANRATVQAMLETTCPHLLRDVVAPCTGAPSGPGCIICLGCGTDGQATPRRRCIGALTRGECMLGIRRVDGDGSGTVPSEQREYKAVRYGCHKWFQRILLSGSIAQHQVEATPPVAATTVDHRGPRKLPRRQRRS